MGSDDVNLLGYEFFYLCVYFHLILNKKTY